MKGWQITLLIVALIVVAIVFATRPDPVKVTLVSVERGLVEKTVANTRAGTVKACQRSRLSLPIGGQIAALHVEEGDLVEKGQLLMALWNDDRIAQVEQAKAQQSAAAKERESVCIGATSDRREANRFERLLKQNLASAEQADLAMSKAQASAAACAASNAREKQSAAALALSEAVLAQTYLRAPFAGSVAEVTGEVGEFSTPSPPGVATPPAIDLLTSDCHYISAPIDEVDASEVRVGLPVRVTLDAYRGQTFPAKVRRISSYVQDFEKQARTVEVEAELESLPESAVLLAGYSADMEIIIDSNSDTLRIPSELLLDQKYVLVLEDGVIARRELDIGLSNWHFSEVVGGLQSGDSIISNTGSEGVEPGSKAEVGESE